MLRKVGSLAGLLFVLNFLPGLAAKKTSPPHRSILEAQRGALPPSGKTATGGLDLSFPLGRLNISASGLGLYFENKVRWVQPNPLRVQIYKTDGAIVWALSGYKSVAKKDASVVATGSVVTPGGSEIAFEDVWAPSGPGVSLERNVKVTKAVPQEQGFFSSFELETEGASALADFEPFVPGSLYGDNTYLTPVSFGSKKNTAAGIKDVFIREDRIPAPLIAVRGRDGLALTVIHCDPKGDTNNEDSNSSSKMLVNEVFKFASLGYRETDGRVEAGIWFPGTEGEVTYFGRNSAWTRRYHPTRIGQSQNYRLEVNLARDPDFPAMARRSWRRSFEILNPKVAYLKDVEVLKATVLSHVSGRILTYPNGAIGMPFLAHANTGEVPTNPAYYGPNLEDPLCFGLGFCAENEAVGYWLLRVGREQKNQLFISQGQGIFDFWTSRTKAEPVSPTYYFPKDDRFGACYREPSRTGLKAVCLREIVEGHNGCLLAYESEKGFGVDHPKWLEWSKSFGEWLLTQQQPAGGFPRWWSIADGKVITPSPTSTYNAIPFLCELSKVTGDGRFLKTALRAAEFLWTDHQHRGVFVGGAPDKNDLIDKEAAVLSLTAYLALYRQTKDARWLEAARVAADMAETYMYIWEVPMPVDADPASLDWKPGATTIGVQLVATGSSGVDQWLSWNVDEYAQLYDLTGDPHYFAVARLLFHNTKAMYALPGRTFDVKGPGWQQESWTLSAPNKGTRGGARLETGWVAICHLAGIMKLQERNQDLYKKTLKD